MSQFISPGVYTIEKDLSQYVADLSTTITAMVGTSEKGPTNKPTLITSPAQFVDTFGQQNPKHYLAYAALSYLTKGNSIYVTRVAPTDAAIAKVTTVLPKSAVPFSGEWALVSNSETEATFKLVDTAGISSANKTIKLDPGTVIPGFDFTDFKGTAPANGKLGSDLASFVGKQDFIDTYIKGSSFNITSGSGKDSSATIIGLSADAEGNPLITVNATKFNSFNSPTTSVAVGEIKLKTEVPPAPGTVLATIGNTNLGKPHQGTINLVYDTVGTNYASDSQKLTLSNTLNGTNEIAKLVELEKLVSVTSASGQSNVNISWPLCSTVQASLTLLNGILTSLITVFRQRTVADLTAYPNLSSLYMNARAQSKSGLVGLGSIDVNDKSSGIKAVELAYDNISNLPAGLRLYAINQGSFGIREIAHNNAVLTVKDLKISGSFTTDIYRPIWDLSPAGDSLVPTYLKFSSIGEGDFSNIAITLSFDPINKDNGSQVYNVRVYSRIVSDTVQTTSTLLSDFSLLEQFDGTPEILQSRINSTSRVIRLKIDYTTNDIASLVTGGVVYGPDTDKLTFDPVLNLDVTKKGIALGTGMTKLGASYTQVATFFLQGGKQGTEVTRETIIGDPASKTGIYSYSDPEQMDINLLVVPGWSADPTVAKAMISVCENRSDCMAILDTPFALTVQSAVAYRKNVLNVNTDYAAIYYPWVQITDTVNKKTIFVPPTSLVSGQYAYNDKVGDVYSAPAGRNRGNITEALATERILNQGDRDMLALHQINPIHFEAGYGTYIRGQMTLKSTTTALDRVNVRRLLLKLRKVIATASKYFEFEPGDSITALRLKQLAETVLEDHLRKGAIRNYLVDVGPNVNTKLSLENNELRMSISLTPTKTGEKIIEVFNILGQGKGISIS